MTATDRSRGWSPIGRAIFVTTVLFCFGFGLALIAQVQVAGEGDWYWYARLARQGFGLYSALNLPLQPFFPLETELTQQLFGTSWAASKIPAVVHLALFLTAIVTLVRRSRYTAYQQAIVVAFCFFFGIQFEAYRFDDYHVVSDIAYLFALVVAGRLTRAQSAASAYGLAAELGVVSAVGITNRLNDGAMVFFFSVVALAWLPSRRQPLLIACMVAVTAAVTSAIVLSTGDGFIEWASKSVLNVGAIKGGGATFLSDPFEIVLTAWSSFRAVGWRIAGEVAAFAIVWLSFVASFDRRRLAASTIRAAAGFVVAAALLKIISNQAAEQDVARSILALGVLATYATAIAVVVRMLVVEPELERTKREMILFLLPFLMIVSGSLSSAGEFADMYLPAAVFFLLVPAYFPIAITGRTRSFALAAAACFTLFCIAFRFSDPASWFDYRTTPLFSDRTIVPNASLGPMIIDRPLERFVSQLCPLVNDGTAAPELLSMPWPYVNYYCDVPPWRNYVQTWYDTTPTYLAYRLIDDIERRPPEWISYQRQPGALITHEQLFNHGAPLAQQTIDDYVMSKIASGEWKVENQQSMGADSVWYLIRTRFPQSINANLLTFVGSLDRERWRQVRDHPIWRYRASHRDFTVVASNADGGRSSVTFPIAFERTGRTFVSFGLSTRGMSGAAGTGFTVSLVEPRSGAIVGTSTTTTANEPAHVEGFTAIVTRDLKYNLSYTFIGAVGKATVSRPEVTLGGTRPFVDPRLHGCSSTPGVVVCLQSGVRTSGPWRTDPPPVAWRVGPGNRIELDGDTGTMAQATLDRPLRFQTNGPVTIGVSIEARKLDYRDGAGFAVELYDYTDRKVAGSLGAVVARVAPEHRLSFTSQASKSHAYALRLVYDAVSADVVFSNLKVEYGTQSTAVDRSEPCRRGPALCPQRGRT